MAAYQNTDFVRIAKAVDVSCDDVRKFDKQFEAAAMWYRLGRRTPKRIAPSVLAKRLKSVSGHAIGLLKALGIDEASDSADGPGHLDILEALTAAEGNNEDAVVRATARIGHLAETLAAADAASDIRRWAEDAIKHAVRVRKQITLPGHQGDMAHNEWIADMMVLYRRITGRNPGTSVGAPMQANQGKAGGPMIRFLVAAGNPLKITMSPDAWRERVRLILDHSS